jgi:uncharacterized membrane protein YjjP (DUF1212 family)
MATSERVLVGQTKLDFERIRRIETGYRPSLNLAIAALAAIAVLLGGVSQLAMSAVLAAAVLAEIFHAVRRRAEVRVYYVDGRWLALPCLSREHAIETGHKLVRALPQTR